MVEYFVNGLATQLQEVQNRGQQVMKLDILSNTTSLSKRENVFNNLWCSIQKKSLRQALNSYKSYEIKSMITAIFEKNQWIAGFTDPLII